MEKELITALGGTTELAKKLGTTPSAVANWQSPERSIPWKRRPEIARLAAERGVDLPPDFWGQAA